MKKTSVMWFAALSIAIAASSGCNREPKPEAAAETETAPAPEVVSNHVSENDLYMQRLEKDVDITDPDSMLDDLNQQVGDNKANAELARKNAVSGQPVVHDKPASSPLPVSSPATP
jgi:hypothetical protein